MMYELRVLAMVLALLQGPVSNAGITINVKKDFHAAGDGRTDDTQAFLNAVKQVNKLRRNVTLFIPAGEYLLTPQTKVRPPAQAIPAAIEILSLDSCTDVVIKGERGTKIKFSDGLYYGSFYIDDQGLLKSLTQNTQDYKYRVSIGHGIKLTNCKNISVSGIEINGNNGKIILGGEFGDTGYQIDNDGIFAENVSALTITNSYFHHFGRDGILILNTTPQEYNTPSQHIRLMGSRFEYNGRQGLSWVGGAGLSAANCSFSYTGRTKFSSAPRAGVDFEPNGGYVVRDGLFTACRFIDNAGIGIINDEGGPYVRDIRFVNCSVVGGNAAAIWIKGPMFRFSNCNIRGGFLFGCPARRPEDGTQFTGCHFSDAGTEAGRYNFLVESNGSKYLLFDDCDFRVTQKALVFVSPAGDAEEEKPVFNNCRFQLDYRSDTVVGRKAGLYARNTRFTGTTSFINNAAERYSWNLDGSSIDSRKNITSNVTIGKGFTLLTYGAIRVGATGVPATLTVENGGALLIQNDAGLSIEKGSTLILKRGGALGIAPGVNLTIKGSLIGEDGAAVCINDQVSIDKETYGNLHLKEKVTFGDNESVKLGLNSCQTLRK